VSRAVALLAAGWALIALGWAIGNPQFAAPDETDHYVRAAALSGGTLVGESVADFSAPDRTPEQEAWMAQTARRVTVPAGLAPPVTCYITDPALSAGCIDDQPVVREPVELVTPVGAYQPLPYLLPALAVLPAESPAAGNRLARIGGLLPALALLVAAAATIGTLGAVVAVTPMALYSAATLNGSGLEIAAGVAFAAALLRAARPGAAPPRWIWVLAGLSGVALALSRPSGPAWVAAIALLALWRHWAAAHALPGRPRGRAAAAAAAVVAGVAGNRAWEAAHGADATLSIVSLRGATVNALEEWWRSADQLVGGFGYLETDLPLVLVLAWAAILGVLLVLGARAAGPRERALLAVAAVASVVIPVALHVVVIRHTDFGMQARHVLPVLAALPLLAAELARRRPQWVTPAVAAVAAAVHLGAWWSYARRSAVGVDGPWWFVGQAEWAPPGGYWLWIAVVAAGAALVAAAGWQARREQLPGT
jgi:hypothetical protein